MDIEKEKKIASSKWYLFTDIYSLYKTLFLKLEGNSQKWEPNVNQRILLLDIFYINNEEKALCFSSHSLSRFSEE